MKKFKTVKCGVHFYLDHNITVEIIKKRKRHFVEDTATLPENMIDALCCDYLDGLSNYDIWDYFESAIISTYCDDSKTVVIHKNDAEFLLDQFHFVKL